MRFRLPTRLAGFEEFVCPKHTGASLSLPLSLLCHEAGVDSRADANGVLEF